MLSPGSKPPARPHPALLWTQAGEELSWSLPSVQLKIRYSIPASPRGQGEPASLATCRRQVLDRRDRCPPRLSWSL